MTATKPRRVVYRALALALILSLTVSTSALGQKCITQVTSEFLSLLKQGGESMTELDAAGEVMGHDFLALLDKMGKCEPCGSWMANPWGEDRIESSFILSCERGSVLLRLLIEDSRKGCGLRRIEYESDVEKVRRHLRQRGKDPTACVWSPDLADPVIGMGDVQPPVRVSAPRPKYTSQARAAGVEGVVILQATIDKKGNVTDTKVLRGLPGGLGEMAAGTVKRWKFKPATLHGKPVAVYYNLMIDFSLE